MPVAKPMVRGSVALLALMAVLAGRVYADSESGVLEILEDDGESLLKKLTHQEGPPAQIERHDVFAGKTAVKIMPLQYWERNVPGWAFAIAEKPKAGEYRYLRFAWKADGSRGIMIQLHDDKDWNMRFTAGVDAMNWGTKFVSPTVPGKWTVVTRDLFKEFGARTIRGLALTVFDGRAGYFDHIYLGRTIEDLDRIDATGLRQGPKPQLKPADLDRLWLDLGGDDDARAYLAFWTLAAAPEQSVGFVGQQIKQLGSQGETRQLRTWIAELDSGDFRVRERATRMLAEHLTEATTLLKESLDYASPEAAMRIERLLKTVVSEGGFARRAERAIRLLKQVDSPEARKLLEELPRASQAGPSRASQ